MIKVEKIGDPKEAIALGHAAGKEIKNIAGPVKFAEYGAAVAEVQAAAGTTSTTPISPISSVPSPPFQYYPTSSIPPPLPPLSLTPRLLPFRTISYVFMSVLLPTICTLLPHCLPPLPYTTPTPSL